MKRESPDSIGIDPQRCTCTVCPLLCEDILITTDGVERACDHGSKAIREALATDMGPAAPPAEASDNHLPLGRGAAMMRAVTTLASARRVLVTGLAGATLESITAIATGRGTPGPGAVTTCRARPGVNGSTMCIAPSVPSSPKTAWPLVAVASRVSVDGPSIGVVATSAAPMSAAPTTAPTATSASARATPAGLIPSPSEGRGPSPTRRSARHGGAKARCHRGPRAGNGGGTGRWKTHG